MKFHEVFKKRTSKYDVWVGFDDKVPEYVIEVFLKCRGGLKHCVFRKKEFNLKDSLFICEDGGFFSKRPYRLAQACDGSIGDCVFALFFEFCKVWNLKPVELYKKAYPDDPFSMRNLKASCTFGNWQEVHYPKSWGRKEFDGLLESLTEINNHTLVGILSYLREGDFMNFFEIMYGDGQIQDDGVVSVECEKCGEVTVLELDGRGKCSGCGQKIKSPLLENGMI